nr:MAG TPA: hypothetical protein [Caudoviricetes sp.]
MFYFVSLLYKREILYLKLFILERSFQASSIMQYTTVVRDFNHLYTDSCI